MHPVILRLIDIKWQLYGNYRTGVYTAVNLFYTILWTSLGVSMPRDNVNGYYSPLKDNIWRIVLEVISLIMAVYFIVTVSFDLLAYYRFVNIIFESQNSLEIRVLRAAKYCQMLCQKQFYFVLSYIT